ncbi:C-terminal binding protein [Clostridium aminobutyricum]|uniref:C-terminal binding protein n=1 Tax=Clostridium aminobutyricum TaxID=33953 RepID=A0A939D7L1_CLOAM|nr:C-terminal binding protein [Clostridium aminobutyricum]MBN7772989.1 C-terminal binding protein [Clostridium aminobutyricum]
MRKYKVVITDREYDNIDNELRILEEINADVYDYQFRNEEDIIRVARDCDALIIQYAKITSEVIEQLEHCKIIAKYATGIDGIDLKSATERGIYVTNVNDYCADEVSTHTLSLLLQLARRIKPLDLWTSAGNWYNMGQSIVSLRKSVVGVISFGRIARMFIDKLKPLCNEIWVYDRFVSKEEIERYGVKAKDFDELVSQADFISIHAPLTEETKHLFNRDVFKIMKSSASIINVARGGLVCEEDLIWALQNGEIESAALDVLETEPPDKNSPLLIMKNVIVTPHIAWYSAESQKKLQSTVAEDVARVLTGKAPENLVNKELLKVD